MCVNVVPTYNSASGYLEKIIFSQIIQEIFSILWIPKFLYYVHKSPSLVSVLIQMNPVHVLSSFFKIHSNIQLRLSLPSGPLSSGIPTNSVCISLFPVRAICHTNLFHLDLIASDIWRGV